MSKRESQGKQIRQRHRRAAERLMENSSLRDGLDDEQAGRLLEWGVSRVGEVARRTAGLADEEAEPLLDAQTRAVAAVMGHLNEWMSAEPAQSAANWQALVDALEAIEPPLPPEKIARAATLMLARHNQESSSLFDRVMALIEGESGGVDEDLPDGPGQEGQ